MSQLAGNTSALTRETNKAIATFMWEVQEILNADYESSDAIGQIREAMQDAQKKLSDAALAFNGQEKDKR